MGMDWRALVEPSDRLFPWTMKINRSLVNFLLDKRNPGVYHTFISR